MTQEYAIWTPKHHGHAPPNWREGMWWGLSLSGFDSGASGKPIWSTGYEYHVPPEALGSPNDDAKRSKEIQSFRNLLQSSYTPEELAAHGITLAPEKEWATELWADIWEARGLSEDANLVRKGVMSAADRVAIDLLRARAMPKGSTNA